MDHIASGYEMKLYDVIISNHIKSTSQQLSRCSVPICILHIPPLPVGHFLPVAEIEEILRLRQEARRPASKSLKLLQRSQRSVDSCSEFEYIKIIKKL